MDLIHASSAYKQSEETHAEELKLLSKKVAVIINEAMTKGDFRANLESLNTDQSSNLYSLLRRRLEKLGYSVTGVEVRWDCYRPKD